MQVHADRIRELLEEADHVPESSARLAVLEEAVRVADAHQDIRLGIETRYPLMHLARSLLRGEVLATAFVWCLAQYDRDPEQFAGRNLLWEQHEVIGQLSNLYDISRAKLEEMQADYGRRLQLAGLSLRGLHEVKLYISRDLGDRELAREATAALQRYPHDGATSDIAWELSEAVQTELFLGREERALQLAEPFLKDRSSYRTQTDSICAYLLVPLLNCGRGKEAAVLHRRCLRTFRPQRCYYWPYGGLFKFSALTNDLGRAVHLYEECQRAITRFTDPLTRLHFALDAIVVFDRLATVGKWEVSLRLPEYVPVVHKNGQYHLADLRDWLRREAGDLAERFDTRNGNSYFRDDLQQRAGLQRLATDVPGSEGK
jgi:hypothetical protein